METELDLFSTLITQTAYRLNCCLVPRGQLRFRSRGPFASETRFWSYLIIINYQSELTEKAWVNAIQEEGKVEC